MIAKPKREAKKIATAKRLVKNLKRKLNEYLREDEIFNGNKCAKHLKRHDK